MTTERPQPGKQRASVETGTDGTAGEPNQRSDPEERHLSVDEIRACYEDYANWFERFDRFDRFLTGRYRRELFGEIDGRVLDVACGTGVNFPYLPESVDLVAIDASPSMLEVAEKRLDRLGLTGTVREMDAQDLAFDANSFDTVISSLSTCTFPDPIAALEEMGRVCAPDGRILLLEHGRSHVGPIAWYQDWRADAHYERVGCRWNQEPLDHVLTAGLPIKRARTRALGIITMIEATPQQKSAIDTVRAYLPRSIDAVRSAVES